MKNKIIYSLLLFLTILACKKDEEIVYGQGTTLKIEIKDEEGVLIEDEITVYLYTDENKYLNDLANGNPINSIYQATSAALGVAAFENISASEIYYIYINYEGKAYTLNNFYGQHTLESPLLADAITSLSIQLKPFNVGSIAFWSTEFTHGDIEVFIGDSLIGTVNNVSTTAPNDVNDVNVLPVFYQTNGTYTIQAKAENGCFWSQTITVKEKELTAVELTACAAGSVMFWAKPGVLSTNGVLSVFINEEGEQSGQIKNGRSSKPTICDFTATDYLTIERALIGDDTYIYKVVSDDSDCVWVGTFKVTKGCGESIELINCK